MTPSALPSDVRALVEGPNLGHLATLLPDGSPHTVPVWIGLRGDQLVFMTGPDSVKGRNVARDPRVALSIVDAEQPMAMAQVRGRVVETIDGDNGWAIVDGLAQQYLGVPYPRDEARVAYVVEAEHTFAFAP